MGFWELSGRNLKEVWRSPVHVVLLVGMPLAILVSMGLAHGWSGAWLDPDVLAYTAPGVIALGMVVLIPAVAALIASDYQDGVLGRLLVTRLSPAELFLSYLVSLVLIAILQVAVLLGAALLMGLHITGSLALAFLVFLVAALASVGMGMVISTLARRVGLAVGVSWVLGLLLFVLSGAWWPVDALPYAVRLAQGAVPSALAVGAGRDALLRGYGFVAVSDSLLALVVSSLALLVAGGVLFHLKMVRQ